MRRQTIHQTPIPSPIMALPLRLDKQDEDADQCVYAFGTPDRRLGRLILHKGSGDVELETLPSPAENPSARYYLAQAVSRIRTHHQAGQYPSVDRWDA